MARRWYGLWGHRIPVMPDEVATLFVETVTLQPPAPKEAPRPRRVEKPRQAERPQPRQLAAEAPVQSPAYPVAPPPPPAPVVEAPPRTGRTGDARHRAVRGLPGRGRCRPIRRSRAAWARRARWCCALSSTSRARSSSARVATPSGFARLDEAALAAVRRWRCTPAQRDGRPVRAVAMQPFKFELR
jgi:protein TonB